jgi:oligopeptide/dipeptide ABC transporter ATP-binding protein
MTSDPILEVRQLGKYFPVRQNFLEIFRRQKPEVVRAVDGVSFCIEKGEVLALVGESGCGKTTIAQSLIGLTEATKGEIFFKGQTIGVDRQDGKSISLKKLRQKVQVVFQDPYESLNPRASIFDIVAEPLVVHGMAKEGQDLNNRVISSLEEAGLRPAEDFLLRYPHELSGGQRQRVVIASAMILEPELLIADEPVSMLDVSIRAEVLNLLNALRKSRGISILFITHDLGTVAHFADRLAVMYLGRIVEIGLTDEVLKDPQHPYTKALLSVVPVPNPRFRRKMVILTGETPNPINLPNGCRFHPRCPQVMESCKVIDPPSIQLNITHEATCLLLNQEI